MFEGTLVESRGLEHTGTERWTALGSMTIQLAVAGLLIAIPLLHPEALRMSPLAPPVALPLLHKPPVPVQVRTGVAATAMSLPTAAPQMQATRPLVFTHLGQTTEGGPPMLPIGPGMEAGPVEWGCRALLESGVILLFRWCGYERRNWRRCRRVCLKACCCHRFSRCIRRLRRRSGCRGRW